MEVTLISFTTTILSLIWGRYKFFVIRSNKSKKSSIFYDFIVAIHIIATYHKVFTSPPIEIIWQALAALIYALSIGWFFWSISTAKQLDFAFGENVGNLITNGPFKIVRHPFYTCYIVIWSTNTILLNTLVLWITCIALVVFYYISARNEESFLLNSEHAEKYKSMKENVGMFAPRATQWRSWILKNSRKNRI